MQENEGQGKASGSGKTTKNRWGQNRDAANIAWKSQGDILDLVKAKMCHSRGNLTASVENGARAW